MITARTGHQHRRKEGSSPALTGRRVQTSKRIEQALAELARTNANGASRSQITVAALCRLANISRNSLYRYHADSLGALQQLRNSRRSGKTQRPTIAHLREANRELRNRVAKIAALADHYFAAYRESQIPVQRRERELADLRRQICGRTSVEAVRVPAERGR